MTQLILTFAASSPITLTEVGGMTLAFPEPQTMVLSAVGIQGPGGGSSGGVTDGDKGGIVVSGSGAVWTVKDGSITDLMLGASAIALFAAASHTHTIANITGLQVALDGKAATTHTHVAADVTDFAATARGTILTGYAAAGARTALTATDTILGAFGKLGKWVADLAAVAFSGSASDLTAGTLPAARFDDTAHGSRSGGSLHANVVAAGAAGFMTGADKTKLDAITGTNTGDQTITLTGMVTGSGTGSFATSLGSFTKAQLDAAVSDGNVLYVGDVTSNANHTGDATGATALTLATVNANVGAFGSATQVATFTVNAKGLTTAAANVSISIPMTAISDSTAAGRAVLGAASATAQTALFDVFTSGAKGLAPASGGGTTNFLRADGTWAAPAGGAGTNLSYSAATRVIASDTGTDATLPLVTSGDAGLAPASGGGTTNFLRADGTWAAPSGGGGSVALQDEGVSVTTGLATLNVVGLGARVTGTSSAVLTINGLVTAAPATDQADWAPSGFDAGTGTIYMQPTTNSFLTGLSAGAAGQNVVLINDSDYLICLERESGASTAANRFEEGSFGSVWLMPQESVLARYSSTLSRWVIRNQSHDPRVIDGRVSLFLPANGATPAVIGTGGSAVTATASTNSPTATPTNDFAEYGNFQVSNSTGSGSSSVRNALAMFMRGATAGRQGFFHTGVVRFTALGATGAVRAGVIANTGAITGLSAAQVNCLFVGADAGHTNLRIFSGNAAAGTPVDLGANFPVPSATAAYDYAFYAPPSAAYVRYMVRRLDSRFVAEGSLTANIPVNTTALAQRLEVAVGATAVANTALAAYLLTRGL